MKNIKIIAIIAIVIGSLLITRSAYAVLVLSPQCSASDLQQLQQEEQKAQSALDETNAQNGTLFSGSRLEENTQLKQDDSLIAACQASQQAQQQAQEAQEEAASEQQAQANCQWQGGVHDNYSAADGCTCDPGYSMVNGECALPVTPPITAPVVVPVVIPVVTAPITQPAPATPTVVTTVTPTVIQKEFQPVVQKPKIPILTPNVPIIPITPVTTSVVQSVTPKTPTTALIPPLVNASFATKIKTFFTSLFSHI